MLAPHRNLQRGRAPQQLSGRVYSQGYHKLFGADGAKFEDAAQGNCQSAGFAAAGHGKHVGTKIISQMDYPAI